MSHQIDFSAHQLSKVWNRHWSYPMPVWKIIRGKRPYLINRAPYSHHIQAIRQAGFEIKYNQKCTNNSGIGKAQLAMEYKDLSDDDLATSGALIQAIKPVRVRQTKEN